MSVKLKNVTQTTPTQSATDNEPDETIDAAGKQANESKS